MKGKYPMVSGKTERNAKGKIARGNYLGAFKTIMKEIHAKHDASIDDYDKAWSAFKKGDYKTAIEYARSSMKGHPRDPDTWFIISESQYQLGLWLECSRSCEKRLAIDPSDMGAAVDIAYCLHHLEKDGMALEWCNKALARPKSKCDTAALYLKAEILEEKGKWGDLTAVLQILTKTCPKDAALWYELAWAQHENRQHAAAIEAMRRYVKLEPKDHEGHCSLGYFLEVSDMVDQAADEYLRAIKLDPGDDYARGALQRIRAHTRMREYGGAGTGVSLHGKRM